MTIYDDGRPSLAWFMPIRLSQTDAVLPQIVDMLGKWGIAQHSEPRFHCFYLLH